MNFKAIVCTVVLIATIQLTFAKLEDGKTYTIQNVQDKMYLTTAKNGQFCKTRGDVITAALKNPKDVAQEWVISGNDAFQYLINGYFNEITYASKDMCSGQLNPLKITQIVGDGYTIENIETKKCLKSAGSEKRIIWDECVYRTTKNHYWTFVEVRK